MINYVEKHNVDIVDRFICLAFVVSLGVGEIISIGPIKLSYVTTFIFFFYTVIVKKKNNIFRNRYSNNLLFFAIIMLLYPLLQFLWSKDSGIWLVYYRTLFINVSIVILLINYIGSYKDWILVVRSFLFLILICLIIGAWEYMTGNHLTFVDYSEMSETTILLVQNKPLSFYGNINDNSSVLFLGLIVALIYFFKHKTKRFVCKIVRLLFCSLIVWEIIIINARAITYSMILLIVSIAFFWIVDRLSKCNSKKSFKIVLSLLLIVLILIAIALCIYPLDYYLAFISSGTDYSSDIVRIKILKDGFTAFCNTFFLGLGPGQSITINNINLHSMYLEILFEYGLFIGGGLLLVFLSISLKKSINASGLCDYVIKSFPVVMILAGVSSSKLFSIRSFWIAFVLILVLKYSYFDRNYKVESIINNRYSLRIGRCFNEY